MTREELIRRCSLILRTGGDPAAVAARERLLADLLLELTGKTPETPKKTRGMEIAEKVVVHVAGESIDWLNFKPTNQDDPNSSDFPMKGGAADLKVIRRYIADAIDAAEPQCKLPVIEYREGGYVVGGSAFTLFQASAIASACGYSRLADYPNLKERK